MGAKKKFNKIEPLKLYNLLYPRYQKVLEQPTKVGCVDQFIVSGHMLKSNTINCLQDMRIFNPKYLLHYDSNNQPKPNRTYSGKYTGGYSDHCPFLAYISEIKSISVFLFVINISIIVTFSFSIFATD